MSTIVRLRPLQSPGHHKLKPGQVDSFKLIQAWINCDTCDNSRCIFHRENRFTLKQKCLHFDEIFITDCTERCQNDNVQCSQWWKFRQNDDIACFLIWHDNAYSNRRQTIFSVLKLTKKWPKPHADRGAMGVFMSSLYMCMCYWAKKKMSASTIIIEYHFNFYAVIWTYLDILIHWNRHVIILTKFPSLAAAEVVKMTTFAVPSVGNIVKMSTIPLQCISFIAK